MCLRPAPCALRPASPLPVPDDTAHVARLAFPRGNLLLSLRDRLGPVFLGGPSLTCQSSS